MSSEFDELLNADRVIGKARAEQQGKHVCLEQSEEMGLVWLICSNSYEYREHLPPN